MADPKLRLRACCLMDPADQVPDRDLPVGADVDDLVLRRNGHPGDHYEGIDDVVHVVELPRLDALRGLHGKPRRQRPISSGITARSLW